MCCPAITIQVLQLLPVPLASLHFLHHRLLTTKRNPVEIHALVAQVWPSTRLLAHLPMLSDVVACAWLPVRWPLQMCRHAAFLMLWLHSVIHTRRALSVHEVCTKHARVVRLEVCTKRMLSMHDVCGSHVAFQ
jgi:hypothetical protein